jgi:hypothetical protein
MKKPILLLTLIFLFSCSSQTKYLTNQKEGWFKDQDFGLVYCKVENKKDGSTDPLCFEAGFVKSESQ